MNGAKNVRWYEETGFAITIYGAKDQTEIT